MAFATVTPAAAEVKQHFLSGDKPSAVFQVRVWGEDVFVTEFHGAHYAHASCAGKAEIVVTVSEPVKTFSISPLRRKIAGRSEGNTLRFAVPREEPRYFLIRVNALPLLALLLDPPESKPVLPGDKNVVNAADFVADTSGKSNVTDGLAKAIVAVNNTGKTLYIGPGRYRMDGLYLKGIKNCGLYLASGALLQSIPGVPGATNWSKGLHIEECENLTISGRGVIDNAAYETFMENKANYRKEGDSNAIFIYQSKGITVEGILARNSRNWNCRGSMSDRVVIRHCKVITPPECMPEWTDGYNFSSCQDLLLENCFAYCNDDSFASGHYYPWPGYPACTFPHDKRDQKNYVIRGLVAWNPRANGIRIGWASRYHLGDFIFENCDFIGQDDQDVCIHGESEGCTPAYGRIQIRDCGFEGDPREERLIYVGGARFDRLELSGVVFFQTKPSLIQGHPREGLREVLVENLVIQGKTISTFDNGKIQLDNILKSEIR